MAELSQTVQVPVRRGLPRMQGGEPWPPVDMVDVADEFLGAASGVASAPAAAAAPQGELIEVAVRRGLPRVSGGEPWPPVTSVTVEGVESPADTAESVPQPEPAPAPAQPAAQQGTTRVAQPVARGRGFRWIWPLVAAAVLLLVGVLLSRRFVHSPAGADFIAQYNGAQPLPENAPVGLPAWLGWAHFFNMFLMALIVKTGWSVRTETKPAAYWASRRNPKTKISLTLWLHLVLDVAWVVLGAVFYILLFTTGQWVRIVPTSWEVFPNAVSAGIQYLSLEWPTENPWVHYNALQELMYFAVVFIAAPLAIISGLRMSPWWPKGWTWLPMSLARAVHFPVMVFFVVFTVIHVALVALTGLRVNLNAMFAASESATSWTGVLVFLGALAAIVAAWFAARPLIVAPVAGKFGTVSQR